MKRGFIAEISKKILYNICIFLMVFFLIIVLTGIPKNLDFAYYGGKLEANMSFSQIIDSIKDNFNNFVSGEVFAVEIRGVPVKEGMKDAMQKSLTVLFAGAVLAIAIGIPKGIFDSRRQNKGGTFKLLQTLIPLSLPDVFTTILLHIFAAYLFRNSVKFLGIGPIFHMGYHGWEQLVYPTIAISIVPACYIARLTAVAIENAYSKQYIMTARGKGCSEFRIIMKHTMKHVITEVIAAFPTIASIMFSSLVIVERIFYYPGMAFTMINLHMTPQIALNNEMVAFSAYAIVLAIVYYFIYMIFDIIKAIAVPQLKDSI